MDEILHKDEENLLSYLDGEMSGQVRTDFERRLKEEPDLQERLRKLQLAISAVQQYGAGEKVKSVHAEMMPGLRGKSKGKVISMPRLVRYSVAAAASILVLFLAVKLLTANRVSADKLFNEAYVSYDAGT